MTQHLLKMGHLGFQEAALGLRHRYGLSRRCVGLSGSGVKWQTVAASWDVIPVKVRDGDKTVDE